MQVNTPYIEHLDYLTENNLNKNPGSLKKEQLSNVQPSLYKP